MNEANQTPSDGTMSLLDHLDELRSRLLKSALFFLALLAACWFVSEPILQFLLEPIRQHFFGGDDIVFINLTEPFLIYMKAAAITALFASAPFLLYQTWAFVAPGLYKRERRWVVPFMFFGSLFFIGGGAFGYYVAVPVASGWLLGLGEEYTAQITLRSAFSFLSWILLGMGLVFELPIVIFFLARIGLVTPAFLMRHFRFAVLIIAVLAAILTPTPDVTTMAVFAAPMIVLYLLGVAVAWLFGKKD